MAWSDRLVFRIFLGVAFFVGVGLVYLDRHKEAPPDPIIRGRTIWNASGISNYEFTIMHYGANPAPPMQVVVRSGAIQSVSLFCPPPRTEVDCRQLEQSRKDIYGPDKLQANAKTIPQLFDQVSSARTDSYDWDARVFADFDPTYGFPTRFSFDHPNGSDEEYAFEISEFTITQ